MLNLDEHNSYKDGVCFTKKEFDEYYKDKEKAIILCVSNPKKYDKPINPYEMYKNFRVPKSFLYLDNIKSKA